VDRPLLTVFSPSSFPPRTRFFRIRRAGSLYSSPLQPHTLPSSLLLNGFPPNTDPTPGRFTNLIRFLRLFSLSPPPPFFFFPNRVNCQVRAPASFSGDRTMVLFLIFSPPSLSLLPPPIFPLLFPSKPYALCCLRPLRVGGCLGGFFGFFCFGFFFFSLVRCCGWLGGCGWVVWVLFFFCVVFLFFGFLVVWWGFFVFCGFFGFCWGGVVGVGCGLFFFGGCGVGGWVLGVLCFFFSTPLFLFFPSATPVIQQRYRGTLPSTHPYFPSPFFTEFTRSPIFSHAPPKINPPQVPFPPPKLRSSPF